MQAILLGMRKPRFGRAWGTIPTIRIPSHRPTNDSGLLSCLRKVNITLWPRRHCSDLRLISILDNIA